MGLYRISCELEYYVESDDLENAKSLAKDCTIVGSHSFINDSLKGDMIVEEVRNISKISSKWFDRFAYIPNKYFLRDNYKRLSVSERFKEWNKQQLEKEKNAKQMEINLA